MKFLDEAHASRAVVVGLGLIGGSLAAALRKVRPAWTVVGHDINAEAAGQALRDGLVDDIEGNRAVALQDADVVILASPVGAILDIVAGLEREVPGEAFVLDVGSTKGRIVAALNMLPDRLQAVGGHPMTGAITAGVSGPHAGLFEGRHFVLTPTRTTRPATLAGATSLVGDLGAVVTVMEADRHDAAVALVSHLPYLASLPLLDVFRQAPAPARALAAGGFRSRVKGAGANIPMWWDILRTNRDAVVAALADYGAAVASLRELVRDGTDQQLRDLLERAAREAAQLDDSR